MQQHTSVKRCSVEQCMLHAASHQLVVAPANIPWLAVSKKCMLHAASHQLVVAPANVPWLDVSRTA
jgi:hypothetical protein